MTIIAWNSSLSVNISRFDDQHKSLLIMINELHDAMMNGTGNEVLEKTLDALICYTVTHFADEEQLMDEYGYPDSGSHKSEHEMLVRQVQDLQQCLVTGRKVLTLDVMMFLRDWLMQHIQVADKKYGTYLNSRGVT